MVERVSVSVKEDQKEILDWVEERVDDGTFRSKSHAFCHAVKIMKDSGVKEYNV